ncbi:PAS domain-containing hybrid sensor histidine kinase/response regulator [Flavobacterium restrictum]|uniref:histidine kinase n=1 Tax=Flavobacterium restrictum TaxID=2594428 RepID=A0A553E369_9FLAO|nr:PAS domain S-box protein [Flavobacterium restrictum]TRX39477.1 PAS domain S-box protein [Flavobacterium restrictum]
MTTFHKLLEKQIKKHLDKEQLESPAFKAFIHAVNDSYLSFERDNDLMDHSFKESEKEYQELNANLKKEQALKQQSISNLYDSLEILDDHYTEINPDDDVDDLLFISKYLNKQIEKRKISETNLSQTVKLLKTLLNNLQSGVLVEDEHQKILFSNQLFWDQKKKIITPKAIEGVDFSELFVESKFLYKDPEIFVSRIKDLLQHKKLVIGDLIETIDNRFLERDYIPIYINKEYKGQLWKYTDVTERIQSQILLEQSEERSRIVMNASLNAIVTVDDKAQITFWNQQATAVFGWEREEVLGKVFTDFMVPSRNKALWDGSIRQYLEEGYNAFLNQQVELFGVHKSGDEFLAEITITPITQNGETFFCAFLQDISKRKEAENKLYETVALLKTLLANLHSGILVEDENRKILFTNQHFCDMRHLKTAPEELIGMDCTTFIGNSKLLFLNPSVFVNRVNEILEQKKIVIAELIETTDNQFYERDYIPVIIHNEYKGHLWKYTDVTHRIKTQNLLEQSEERSRFIMNASLNAIITIDIKGKITFWNQQAEFIFGWKSDAVLGKSLTETIVPNQHKKGHDNGMKHYIKTGEGPVLNKQIELTAMNIKGEEFPVEISIIPLKQNGELFFCSFIQDISERKKAENSLKIQEEKYRNIIANMNMGIIEVDTNEVIQFANQSFSVMTGYEINELMGKNPSEIFVFGENQDLMASKNVLRQQGVSDVYQIPIKNKRGELKWWAISGAPNYDDKGKLVGSIGIHLDITEQKQLEIELEAEKIKAEEASKAKEAFLSTMSHEIRTPLNAIIGFLRELGKQELTELQKKYIDNSAIASKHLLAILNNVLDISKIEAGEMELEKEDFIFEDSVQNVIKVLKPKAKQKGIRLTALFSEKLNPVFKGDALRMEQILFNLIGNALKFTPNGKIEVFCELLTDNSTFQEMHISIADTGIGMDKSYSETLFKKFSQEDKAVTRRFGGTGLGMAITKELVQLMGGTITVESEKNKGTTIHIYLSLLKGNLENVKKPNPEININIEGISILLVEDNKMNRMVVQNSMQYFNCKVTEAKNGVEALEILKKQNFDIILMDIQMPEMDGFEATRIIRNEFKLTTPIIALTANAFKSETEKCKQAGMDDYVTKPFDEIVLLETIAKHTVNKIVIPTQKSKIIQNNKNYNLNTLHNLSRGNDEFVKKMLTIFVEQTTDTIAKTTLAIANNNFIEVSRLIHKIKPSVASLGINSIQTEIKTLEKVALTAPSKEQILTLFIPIKTCWRKL